MAELIIAGLLLILLGQGWLWLLREYATPGRHALSRAPRQVPAQHRGWEGREHELTQVKVDVLLAQHTARRWPTRDQDAAWSVIA